MKTCLMINLTLLDVRKDNKQKLEPRSDLEEAQIYRDEDERAIHIGVALTAEYKAQLLELMKKYKEIFSWILIDMSSIDISLACHKLSIDPTIKLI